MKRSALSVFFALLLFTPTFAQEAVPPNEADRIAKLEREVRELRSLIEATNSSLATHASNGALTLLYMFFCGTWAYSMGRSFWIWWILGVFNVITVFILLFLSAGKRNRSIA